MKAKLQYIGVSAMVVGFGALKNGQVIEVEQEQAIPLARLGGVFALVDTPEPPKPIVQEDPQPTMTEAQQPVRKGRGKKTFFQESQ